MIALYFVFETLIAFGAISDQHNCRIWAIVGESVPGSVIIGQLFSLPNSLENLSYVNPNGWGIGYYEDSINSPVIARGTPAAYLDPRFDSIAQDVSNAAPHVAVAHIRYCTSGLCNIANPHPFEREKLGKYWMMGHNGSIDKSVLLKLLRPDYLANNPPSNGATVSEWIDSELYFLFMLQSIEDRMGDVKPALGYVIKSIRDSLPTPIRQLNFFLTDGATLWGYCEGHTMYFMHDTDGLPYSSLASQYPGLFQDNWVEMIDGQIVTFRPTAPPELENIESYFENTGIDITDDGNILGAQLRLMQNCPNPFNSTCDICFDLQEETSLELDLFNILGQKVRVLSDGHFSAGRHLIQFDGTGLASGIYFYRIETDKSSAIRKMILAK